MIKGEKTIEAKDFMEKIAPVTGWSMDSILMWMNQAVSEKRDFVMIFRDYHCVVPHASAKAWLEKSGAEKGAGEAFTDPVDALIPPPKADSKTADLEEEAIKAKHETTMPRKTRKSKNEEQEEDF